MVENGKLLMEKVYNLDNVANYLTKQITTKISLDEGEPWVLITILDYYYLIFLYV
jgi:hypothetical protein